MLVTMFSFGIVASADTVYGITIDEDDTLDQTVDPEYNDKIGTEYFENHSAPSTFSESVDSSDQNEAQGDIDSLVDSQQSGVTSAIDYVESFIDSLTAFQASFFSFVKVFETFSGLPVISFLIYASIGVGMLAFFLNTLPAIVSKVSAREKAAAKSKGSG